MAAIPTGGTDDERLRAILLHLKAKRDSITSYTMDIAWERYEFPETPSERLPCSSVPSVVQKVE